MRQILTCLVLLVSVACGDDDGVTCGDGMCAEGEVCCGDCDGTPVCISGSDGTCPMIYCDASIADASGDATSTLVDGSITAEGGVCGGSGQACCDPAPGDGPNYCNGGLMCCSGVPYPDEGVCATECDARSDRNAKQDFEQVDTEAILETLRKLPIQRWQYREREGAHIGPMAQDFHAAFAVGNSDKVIAGVDAQGVLMASVQALASELEHERAQRRQLEQRLRRLERRAN